MIHISASAHSGDARPSRSWFILAFILVAAAQIALYHEAFGVKLSGDDFSGLTIDIHRANLEGPVALFRETTQAKNYRPLQSFLMWLFARGSMPEPYFAIRVLHVLSMAMYGLTMLLWVRRMRVSKVGAIVALLVMFLHPMLSAPMAGIDGFSSLLAGAFMWLAALAAYEWRDRWWLSAAGAGACLVVGSLIKEYTFAALPLSVWAVLVLPSRIRWRTVAAVGIVLTGLIVALMAIRPFIVPAGLEGKIPTPHVDPVQVAKNLGLFAAVPLYFGSTVWVFVQRTPVVLAMFVASCFATIGLLGIGLWRAWRQGMRADQSDEKEAPTVARWVVFLLLSFFAATFPANILKHVSEQYAVGLALPLALLAGLAAEGIRRATARFRTLAAMLFAGQIILAATAVLDKVRGIRDCGDRATHQAQELIKLLPPDAHDLYLALVFVEDDTARQRVYSVYTMRDSGLLHPGQRLKWNGTLEWWLPRRGLDFERLVVKSVDDTDLTGFDLALLWHSDSQTFSILKPPTVGLEQDLTITE